MTVFLFESRVQVVIRPSVAESGLIGSVTGVRFARTAITTSVFFPR
jgi:hypothetical protein